MSVKFVDYKTYDVDDLTFSEPSRTFPRYRRIQVYPDEKQKKKVVVQTPKMIMPFDMRKTTYSNKVYYHMSLSFRRRAASKNVQLFLEFMQDLDDRILEVVRENRDDWIPEKHKYSFRRSVLDEEFNPYISVRCPYEGQFRFNVFDKDKNQIDASALVQDSELSVIMELSELWINTQKREFGCNWVVLQVKKYGVLSYVLEDCLFEDEDEDENEETVRYVTRCLECQRKVDDMGQPHGPPLMKKVPAGRPPTPPPLPPVPLFMKDLKKGVDLKAVIAGRRKDGIKKPVKQDDGRFQISAADILSIRNNLKKSNGKINIPKAPAKKQGSGFAPSLNDILSIRNALKKSVDKPVQKVELKQTSGQLIPSLTDILSIRNNLKAVGSGTSATQTTTTPTNKHIPKIDIEMEDEPVIRGSRKLIKDKTPKQRTPKKVIRGRLLK